MEPTSISAIDLVLVIGLTQGVLFSLSIFRNKIFKNSSNRHFAFFVLILVIIGLDSVLSTYYGQLNTFWLTFFDVVGDDIPWVMMCYLPLFTFFLETTQSKIKVPIAVLYMPFALFVLFNLLIDLDFDFHLIAVPWITKYRELIYELEDYIAILLFLSLHIYVYFLLNKKSANRWLKQLWWSASLLILLWISYMVDHFLFEDEFSEMLVSILWICVSVFIYWLTYTGLFNFNLARNRKMIKAKLNQVADQEEQPKSIPKISNSYFEKLLSLMDEKAIYRNEDLSRETVAVELGISNSYLTQLIKERTEKSFTGFVNEYRVKDVERMLMDDSFENFDVLSIGLEAGFKSKSAFYSTFKRFHGLTPTQFRKKQS